MDIVDEVKPLSEKLRVPPLKDGEKVVFKLCSVGKREHGREEPAAPELYQLSAKEIVTDPFDKAGSQKKVIGTYITDYKQVQNQLKPVYAAPVFKKGYLTVGSDDPATYERLLRSKHCVSNKFRKVMGKGKDLFMLVEDAKEINDQLLMSDIRFQAEKMVRESSWATLKAICAALNQSPDQRLHVRSYIPGVRENDLQGMKMELITKVQLYPKQVIAASDNDMAKLQVQVYESLTFGILIFEKKSYYLLAKNDMELIHTPAEDKDPMASLIDFLSSEAGAKSYVKIATALKEVLTPKARG